MLDRQQMAHFIYLSKKTLFENDYQTQKAAASPFCESFSNNVFIFFLIANYADWAITCWPFGGEGATPQNIKAKTWIS